MTRVATIMIAFSVVGVLAFSQFSVNDQIRDSQIHKLALTNEDTSRVLIMANIAAAFWLNNPDSALSYALAAFKLAEEIKFMAGVDYCSPILARSWWSVGDYPTGIKLLLSKIDEIESTHDSILIIFAYATLADSYRDLENYDQALMYRFRGERFMDKNCTFCQTFCAAIASDYLGKKRLDSARFYINKAFTFRPNPSTGWPMYIKGEIYSLLQKSDSAFFCYRRSITILLNDDNLKDLADVYNSIAALFRSNGLTDSALYYAHKALSLSLSKRFAREAMQAYAQISSSYERSNTDSALRYYRLAIAAKDTLYNQEKQRQILSYQFDEQLRSAQTKNAEEHFKNRIRIFFLLAAAIVFLIVGVLLLRNNRLKQRANRILQFQKEQTEAALEKLKSTQSQLIQSEKMASLGELTSGIAHEIQNPLNFINNFSEVNKELIGELNHEIESGNFTQVKSIARDVEANEEKIINHGKRADAIVKGMLLHSRTGAGEKVLADINAIVDECLKLSYHNMRAKDKSLDVQLHADLDPSIEKFQFVPQDMVRVFVNLFNNAFYAVGERTKTESDGYIPCVSAVTTKRGGLVIISVKDNGVGIPQKIIEKIFQPFFTTKPAGQGTGLGLSLSYDVIKALGGEIKVETRENEGSQFVIKLPT